MTTALTEMRYTDDWLLLGLDRSATDSFIGQGEQLLDSYFRLEDPTKIRPIGVELKVSAETHGIMVRGIIDRLERTDQGDLVVTDYKTGRSPSIFDERARLLGVNVYAHLCEQVLGERPARVQLLFLANQEAIIATPSEQSLRGLRSQVQAVWSAVRQAVDHDDFRPQVSRRCDWCGYRSFCPAHGGQGPPAPDADQLSLFAEPS